MTIPYVEACIEMARAEAESFRHEDPHMEAALKAWKIFYDDPAVQPMEIVGKVADCLRNEFPLPSPLPSDGMTLPVPASRYADTDESGREGTLEKEI